MKKGRFLEKEGAQALIASLICILLGVLIGYIVLLCINPAGASESIVNVLKNFMTYSKPATQWRKFANTLAKTMPLVLCSLSILFAYKVGLFNIGTAGQYVAGACACLFGALGLGLPWYACMLMAICAGALLGCIVGLLKSYCNVNEVISGIMLNWISLYTTNTILTKVKEGASPYTLYLDKVNPKAFLPKMGLDKLFGGNEYVTIAIPLTILIAIAVGVVLDRTKFGYELKATGYNKNAAKYCGMAEKRNIILTLTIAGSLAGLGASFLYQTGYMRWECTQSSVPGMGFNGIAAAFLGGLNPIGAILASFFIQHITAGGAYVDKSMYCAQISDLISAIIIYLCGFVLFMKYAMNSAIARKEEKALLKAKEKEPEPLPDPAETKEGGDE